MSLRALTHTLCLVSVLIACPIHGQTTGPSGGTGMASFENRFARLTLNAAGEVVSILDRQTGNDLVDHAVARPLATVRTAKGVQPVTRLTRQGDRLSLVFGAGGIEAELKLTVEDRYLVLDVVAVRGADVQSLDLIDVPLTLKGGQSETMAGCVLALNLKTNVQAIPQATNHLKATGYAKFGITGTKAAIILCPLAQLREVMKQVVSAADELPHSPIGGPWALDSADNRESYILECTGQVGEDQIDRWIAMLRGLGMRQLDFHTGGSLRFGDYTPNPKVYPKGLASVKAVTDKLHAAQMLAGLHTYAFFIAKDSPFIRPVPDAGLAFDATYTLAADLPIDAATLPVNESTANVSAITGFFVQNSVTLWIDDELVVYKGAHKDAPFAFTECQRGAHGTKPAAHAAGAKVRHLKECFGLFVPDPDGPLFTAVIDSTARAYNEGGFDMIYLDALDGEGILGGGEWGWYYGSKFVFELAARLNKPALFEMSTFHHHLWYVRSRMGAWDCPARAPKPFIDIHRMVNADCDRMFLPPHLGWWALWDFKGIQPERTFPDVIEYLGCKCLADGCGLSFPAGFTADTYEKSANVQRLGAIVRQYEDVRRSGQVSDAVRRQLGVPEDEFTLETTAEGQPRFRRIAYPRHKLERIDPAGTSWVAPNRFAAQPLQVRIEALLSAADYDAPESTVLEDFANVGAFDSKQASPGSTVSLEQVAERLEIGKVSGRFATTIGPADAAGGRWTMLGRKHSPFLNLTNKGLGLWVYGDGRGETLDLQIKCPVQAYGGFCDRYVKIDFAGWKYVELIEPESDDMPNHGWPYMPRRSQWSAHLGMASAYPAFHYHVMYDQIESLNLWYGNLPADGKTTCVLSPIKALPLLPCKVKNPTITIGAKTLTFPVELTSGQYLEFRGPGDCKVYDAQGAVIANLVPTGQVPDLVAGDNRLTFSAESGEGPHPRAAVTLITRGDPL